MTDYMSASAYMLGDSRALALNYSELDKVRNMINYLSNELEQYINELNNKVISNIYNISGGDSANLSNAQDYIKNKITLLENQKNNADDIIRLIVNLEEKAKDQDELVEYAMQQYEKELYRSYAHLNPHKSIGEYIWEGIKGTGEWLYNFGKKMVESAVKAFGSLIDAVVHLFKGEFLEALASLGACVGYLIDLALTLPIELTKLGAGLLVNMLPESVRDSIKHWYYLEGGQQLTRLIVSGVKLLVKGGLLIAAVAGLTAITGGGFLAVVAAIGAGAAVVSSTISFADAGADLLNEADAYQRYKNGDYIGSARSSGINSCSDYLRKTNFHDGNLNKLSYKSANTLDVTKSVSSLVSIASGAYLKSQGVGSFGVNKDYQTSDMTKIGDFKKVLSNVDSGLSAISDASGADFGDGLNKFSKSIMKTGIEHVADKIWDANGKNQMRYAYDNEIALLPNGGQISFVIFDDSKWKLNLWEKLPKFFESSGKTAGKISDNNKGVDSFSMTGLTPVMP